VDLREPVFIPTAALDLAGESLADCASAMTYDLITDALEAIGMDSGVHEVGANNTRRSTDNRMDQEARRVYPGCEILEGFSDHVEKADSGEMMEQLASIRLLDCASQFAGEIQDWENTKEDTVGYWEAADMDHHSSASAAHDELEEVPSEFGDDLLEVDVDDENDQRYCRVEDNFRCDMLAFDVAGNAMDNAFEEMYRAYGVPGACSSQKVEKEAVRDSAPARSTETRFAPAESTSTKEEDVNAKIRKTLCKALQSGALSKELRVFKFEAVRQKLTNVLAAAASTQALDRVIRELIVSRQESPKADLEHTAQESSHDVKVNVPPLRQEVAPSHAPSGGSKPLRSTHSKKRLVFGAVVRAPALEHREDLADKHSNAAESNLEQCSISNRKLRKSSPSFVNLEHSQSSSSSGSFPRTSSLATGYNASVATSYSLNRESAATTNREEVPLEIPSRGGRSTSWEQEWNMQVAEFGAPAFDRPLSKACARRRSSSLSAMALDLGCMDQVYEQSLSSSSSLPSLRFSGAKISHAGMLPLLPASKKSAKTIASTMQLSRATTKWCDGGLRNSASAVF
jgi:hypothetical protein